MTRIGTQIQFQIQNSERKSNPTIIIIPSLLQPFYDSMTRRKKKKKRRTWKDMETEESRLSFVTEYSDLSKSEICTRWKSPVAPSLLQTSNTRFRLANSWQDKQSFTWQKVIKHQRVICFSHHWEFLMTGGTKLRWMSTGSYFRINSRNFCC